MSSYIGFLEWMWIVASDVYCLRLPCYVGPLSIVSVCMYCYNPFFLVFFCWSSLLLLAQKQEELGFGFMFEYEILKAVSKKNVN